MRMNRSRSHCLFGTGRALKRPFSTVEQGIKKQSRSIRKRVKRWSGHALNLSENEEDELFSDTGNANPREELVSDTPQSPAAGLKEAGWPEEIYERENVVGCIPDPDDDTGNEICKDYDDNRVENRGGVIEQQDLDLGDIQDSAEAVERVARTTIAEQMGEGVADAVAAFFDEKVEKIKDRTYKMWLPGLRRADENGGEMGLYSFQLVGVRFLVTNVKSTAHGGFLCDDMGLGKTIQALGVCQVLRNHAQLTYLVNNALNYPNGTRTDQYGNIHRGKGSLGPCPSQKAIKKRFGICCNCWKGSPTGFDVRDGPVLNIVPSQLIWTWHRDWLKFFDPKHPLSIQHKGTFSRSRLSSNLEKGQASSATEMREVIGIDR
jgi:hypothetical protein